MLSYSTLQTIIQMFRMVADILILWVLLYYSIKIVRNNSRTAQIFKGIILILIIRAIANFFGFKAVDWLAGVLVTYGFLAIIIIFQPEIRAILERLGKNTFFSRLSTLSGNERERLVEELVSATMYLSTNRVGALITLEQGHSLNDFVKTGTQINSLVTADLLTTIFLPNTPIHDGAVIIQGDRIACASAYFPPTNMVVPTRFGARHRAAIGISEITDSVTIVISEKSGRVSIAEDGKLIPMNQSELKAYLQKTILHGEEEVHNTESSKVIVPVAPVLPSPEVIQDENETESVSKVSKLKKLFTPNPKYVKPVESELDTLKEVSPIKPTQQILSPKEEPIKEEVVVDHVETVMVDEVIEETVNVSEAVMVDEVSEDHTEPVLESFEHIEDVVVSEMATENLEPIADANQPEIAVSQEIEVEEETKSRRKKTLEPLETKEEHPVVEVQKTESEAVQKKGFFSKLFGSKTEPKKEESVQTIKEEKDATPKASESDKPKRSRKKKTDEPTGDSLDVKIKETPHIKLEYSVSDESLLDDDFDQNSSKGGE